VYYLTHEGASDADAWRLAEGKIVDDRLQAERFVDGVEDYYFAYPYLGLAVRRCAGDDVG
jgi:hypothetical protein